MANNCEFSMRITGGKKGIEEMISMLKWEGQFKNNGLGRVYCFETLQIQPTEINGVYTVDGHGYCAWSVLTAMRYEYCNSSLESETKRLGLVVEIYSSEPGFQFQEHCLIVKGVVVMDEVVDYNEYRADGASENELEDLCRILGYSSKEELMNRVNENGDVCAGGFGSDYGVFEDVLEYFM